MEMWWGLFWVCVVVRVIVKGKELKYLIMVVVNFIHFLFMENIKDKSTYTSTQKKDFNYKFNLKLFNLILKFLKN